MRAVIEVRTRLAEIKGEIRYFNNRDALGLEMTAEMYEVMDALAGEQSALEWVLEDE